MGNEEKVYKCDSCGGVMEWNPKSNQFECPNCGNFLEIDNDESKIVENKLTDAALRKVTVSEKETKTMECKGCGAKIEVAGSETALECPYCGSSYVLSQKQMDVITPDGVVPFNVDRKQLNKIFSEWIKGLFWAPNALKTLYQKDKFQGVYIPYWTFDAKCNATYSAEGGINREVEYKDSEGNKHTKTETDWYPVTGSVGHFFDDIQVPASTRLKNGLLKGAQPFDFKGLVSFDPRYLSGFMSENYTISLEEGNKSAKKIMDGEMKNLASGQVLKKYDEVRNVRINPVYSKETYKYVLVPVYSTAYKFKDKIYNVVINGQNGKVSGEYPKSYVKIGIAVAIVIIIFILIFALTSGKGDAAEISQAQMYQNLYESMYEDDADEYEEVSVSDSEYVYDLDDTEYEFE